MPYPEELKILLEETNTEGENFRENIRSSSNAVVFASMGANIVSPPSNGPYCFRIHGQIYHHSGPLHAEASKNAQYTQLYILHSAHALQERMGNAGNSRCDGSVIEKVGDLFSKISSFAAAFKMMHEVEQEEIRRSEKEKTVSHSVRMIFDINNRMSDQRRYNLPRANEVAAVFVGDNGEVPTHRLIVVHPWGKTLQTISLLNAHCDPMTYPILFPLGGEGWHPELEKVDRSRAHKRVSMLQFYSYRLTFHRQNQKVLRGEMYKGLMDHIANEATAQGLKPGRMIILPSSFPGSPRAMQQNYQDPMSIVRKYGKPDLFITFTCNPKWKEIEEQLFSPQTASDRADLIA